MIKSVKIDKETLDRFQKDWDNLMKDDDGKAELLISDIHLPFWLNAKESRAYLEGYKDGEGYYKGLIYGISITAVLIIVGLIGVILYV